LSSPAKRAIWKPSRHRESLGQFLLKSPWCVSAILGVNLNELSALTDCGRNKGESDRERL
jgi:hypothetical protein